MPGRDTAPGFLLRRLLLRRKSRITFSNGGADQTNFFDYPLLRIDEMPEIVPIVLASDRPPQGSGEVVLAPVAPAVAQAVLHATGRRLDVMPFPQSAFRWRMARTIRRQRGNGGHRRPAALRRVQLREGRVPDFPGVPRPGTFGSGRVIMRKTGP